jgi:hypothetical protein
MLESYSAAPKVQARCLSPGQHGAKSIVIKSTGAFQTDANAGSLLIINLHFSIVVVFYTSNSGGFLPIHAKNC